MERRRQFGGPTGLTSKAVREAAKQINAACDNLKGDRRRTLKRLWQKNFATLKSEAEVCGRCTQCDKETGPHKGFRCGGSAYPPPLRPSPQPTPAAPPLEHGVGPT